MNPTLAEFTLLLALSLEAMSRPNSSPVHELLCVHCLCQRMSPVYRQQTALEATAQPSLGPCQESSIYQNAAVLERPPRPSIPSISPSQYLDLTLPKPSSIQALAP